MSFKSKKLKVTRIISEQDCDQALDEAVNNLAERLNLKDRLTEAWTLSLKYREENSNE
jgi:hypothetical protein